MKEKWEIKKLGEVCDTLNGLWTGKKEPFINVGVIRNTNFTKDCKLDDTDIAYLDVEVSQFKQRKLQFGDIIIEKSGGSTNQPVGRVVLFEKDNGNFSFSNFTSTIRIKDFDEINPNFLHKYLSFLYFSGYTERLQSNTTGIRNLDFNTYKKTPIPIPPLPVQQSIVAELDTLHRLKELQEQQLTEFDNLAQSTFYSLFGDPIDNEKGWETGIFGDLFSLKSGTALSSKNIISGIYPVFGGNGIVGYHSEYNLIGANIIIGRVGALCGNVRLVTENLWLTDNAFNLIVEKESFNNIFLRHLLILFDLRKYAREALQPVISNLTLKGINVILPPLSLQTHFSERIERIEAQKELIKQSIGETQLLIDYTMDKYFG